jgi:hypothetical protein
MAVVYSLYARLLFQNPCASTGLRLISTIRRDIEKHNGAKGSISDALIRQ